MRAPGFWASRKPTAARAPASAGRSALRVDDRPAHGGARRARRSAGDLRRQFRRRRRRQDAGRDRARADADRRQKARGVSSRGYGGAKRVEPVEVDPDVHDARVVGDEPLLLARVAPCWVGRDRVQSARWRSRPDRTRSSSTTGCRTRRSQGPRLRGGRRRDGLRQRALRSGRAAARAVEAQAPLVRALIVIGGDEAAIRDISQAVPRQADPSRQSRT